MHPTGVDTPMDGLGGLKPLIGRDPNLGPIYLNTLPVEIVEPRDISNAVLFLASDEARYVTGLEFTVDAGNTIRALGGTQNGRTSSGQGRLHHRSGPRPGPVSCGQAGRGGRGHHRGGPVRPAGTVPYPMSTPEDLAETVKEVEALDRRIVATQADVRDYGR